MYVSNRTSSRNLDTSQEPGYTLYILPLEEGFQKFFSRVEAHDYFFNY